MKEGMKKNIAIVGTGYWGKNLVRNFHALGALHTICDTSSVALNIFTQQYLDVCVATSYSDILCNDDIEGVVIATPAETHFNLAKEALLAGKDVFVEKPLCLAEQEGVELNDLGEESRENTDDRSSSLVSSDRSETEGNNKEGGTGRIRYIYSNRLNLGKLRREENVLWSFAPHDISVILGLLGKLPNQFRRRAEIISINR